MRRIAQWTAAAVLAALGALAGFGVKTCLAAEQPVFAGLYGALALLCLGMAAASVWPERKKP